ncbi:MAG TPA: type I phosphomannose isomerase catalytic subunit [Ktedonobacterales bacterium]|nr:type I phosphomannose isomerase catalytic subunit [Ktedonobacterales bacterium]
MAPSGAGLHPIHLRASLHETIWGGQNLARYAGKSVPPGAKVGESWETETGNQVINSPYQGRSLSDLVVELGEPLLGTQALEVFGPRFPLLAKFIDAQDKLSVQVHPADEYARQHEGGKLGKTEAWYILHADPGAALIHGLRRAVTHEEVRHAIADVTLESLLHEEQVQAGDVVFVPAGTVHAIGAGIVLYELQEYSDVTYRQYDYGRLTAEGKPRELHVEKALDVMDYEPTPIHKVRPVVLNDQAGVSLHRCLVACRYFVLEELILQGALKGITNRSSCQILSLLDGTCTLSTGRDEPLALGKGDTVVLPAALGAYYLAGDACRLLRSYVPTSDDALLRRFWSAR